MHRWLMISAALLLSFVVAVGCSRGTGSPVALAGADDLATTASPGRTPSQTHLWGFYDVYIDIPTQTATVVPDRQVMFTANVVNFLNGNPANMGIHVNDTPSGPAYVDVDIDVTLHHPFAGMPQYNGYDVRGVFMGDGSASLNYNPALIYPLLGVDQSMLPDPLDGTGGPDGYTRWYNKPEFSGGGMPLFQYTPGAFASKGYSPTATLCPYKYFADGLGSTDDLWTWLKANPDKNGVFSSGSSNTRKYYLRFPLAKGVKYCYAVLANWEGEDPSQHPSNAPEAIALSVTDNSQVYYINQSDNGGDLKLDITVWDWDSDLTGGVMKDYKIFVESTVLSSVCALNTSQMTPIAGVKPYFTYHVEIPADNVLSPTDNEYWVIVEQSGKDYTNQFGIGNLAGTDPLAAPFKYPLSVFFNHPVCDVQVLTPMPFNGWASLIQFDASATYDTGGGPLTYAWDFNNDGIFGDPYDKGTPDKPEKQFNASYAGDVCVRVTNEAGGESECCVHVNITAQPSKNLPLRSDATACDLAVDPRNADLLILYADGGIWKYYLNKSYSQAYATLLRTVAPQFRFIDVGPTGYIAACRWDQGVPSGDAKSYAPDGGPEYGYSTWFNGTLRDVGTFPGTGNFENSHFIPWGMGGTPVYNLCLVFVADYPTFLMWNQYYEHVFSPWGPNTPYGEYVRGSEGIGPGQLWVVETNLWYAARWIVSPGGGLGYNGAYAGTGVQSDADDSFYNPQDMTRDVNNRLFILDKLSDNTPRIKVFESTGEPAASLGGFGNTMTINSTPLRIEGSDFVDPAYGNLLFVLHGDSPPYKLSIFFPNEMP